jgi:hypothetical protein
MSVVRPIYWIAFAIAYVFVAAITVRAELSHEPAANGGADASSIATQAGR